MKIKDSVYRCQLNSLSGWELKISTILFCPSLKTKIVGAAVFWLAYNYRRKFIEKIFGHSLSE